MQNECPDETEDEVSVAVDNVDGPDVLEVDVHLLEEFQRLADVLQIVHAHFSPGEINLENQ